MFVLRDFLDCGVDPPGDCSCVAKNFLSEVWIEVLPDPRDELGSDAVFPEGLQRLNDKPTLSELQPSKNQD